MIYADREPPLCWVGISMLLSGLQLRRLHTSLRFVGNPGEWAARDTDQ